MMQGMRCACVDIGSNTTRTLVADVAGGEVREVGCEKAYTRLGAALRRTGALPLDAVEAVAAVVAAQAGRARDAGAERTRVVATAAIRGAANADALVAAVRATAGLDVEVLTGEEEAALAFAGATRMHPEPLAGRVAVVDVGGGSSEVAVGTVADGVRWSCSVPVGSSTLTEAGDGAPGAAAAFAAVELPAVDVALAVGGSATSTTRLAGAVIDAAAIRRALDRLARGETDDLDPERVHLLPAGLHLLGAVSARLGVPLTVGRGGLREGACLALAR